MAAGLVTWNQNTAAVAGSPTNLQFPNPVRLDDVAIVTGPTVITGIRFQSGGQDIIGSNFLISTNLSTSNARVAPGLNFKAGSIITAIQF